MWKTYKLREIYAALRDATDAEVPVISNGMKMVTERVDQTPLMELTYALNDSARELVGKYADIS